MTDPVVHTLCASVGHWGLDALSKSSEAYRNRHHRKTRSASFATNPSSQGSNLTSSSSTTPLNGGQDSIVGEISPEFKVLVNGDPYQVEAFIGNMMRDGTAEETFANLKFLFVVLPVSFTPLCVIFLFLAILYLNLCVFVLKFFILSFCSYHATIQQS